MPRPPALVLLAVFAATGACSETVAPDPLGPVVHATFDDAAQPDVVRPAFTDDSLGGRALTGAGMWQAPALGRFALSAGTVEFRLRLDMPAAKAPSWTIFRVRPAGPPEDSYSNGFNVILGWGSGLFLLVGDQQGRQPALAHSAVSEWKPGEWHHCAFTWQVAGPGQSSLAFYVDEALVERRDGLTLAFDPSAWTAAAAAEGKAKLMIFAGDVWGNTAPGTIDDLRIYNHARRYEVSP